MISASQSHTPPIRRVVGKEEARITCQPLSSSSISSRNLEVTKALRLRGICRLISSIAPRLPAAVLRRHNHLSTTPISQAAWRTVRVQGAITGLCEVCRRPSSSSRVTRCRVREDEILDAVIRQRGVVGVWDPSIGHAPDHSSAPANPGPRPISYSFTSHATVAYAHHQHTSFKPQDDDLSIFTIKIRTCLGCKWEAAGKLHGTGWNLETDSPLAYA